MAPRPWRLAEALVTLRNQINVAFPARNHESDGTIGDARHQGSSSDHNPWVRHGQHGVVTAMDVTHDPAHGVDGRKLVELLIKDPRVKYVIFNRKIYNRTKMPLQWRTYRGSNPHDKHFHVSVMSNVTLFDDKKPWNIGVTGVGKSDALVS
jgi:hypothetical protein